MTTKEKVLLNSTSAGNFGKDNANQYSNFNLNQNLKCTNTNYVRLNSKTNNDKSSVVENYRTKDKSQLNKSTFLLVGKKDVNSYKECEEQKVEKRWKRQKSDATSKNSSTLSLHIAAYENSVADSSISFNICKKKSSRRTWLNSGGEKLEKPDCAVSATFQNSFEFPRQQEENQINEPDIMNYRAAQRLFNPNSPGQYQNFSVRQKAECVIWFVQSRNVTEVQRRFHEVYGRNTTAPDQRNIEQWLDQFQETGSILPQDQVIPNLPNRRRRASPLRDPPAPKRSRGRPSKPKPAPPAPVEEHAATPPIVGPAPTEKSPATPLLNIPPPEASQNAPPAEDGSKKNFCTIC